MGMNSKIRFAGWALCALAGVSAFGANAQAAASPLHFTNAVYKEVEVKAADGKVSKKLVPAARAVPGDEVIYEIAYTNNGNETATDVAIDNPLPKEVAFVSAATAPTAVSVDGGKKFGQLAQLSVVGKDGATRPARADDVTNLRWVVPSLAGGASGKVAFRAKVK